MIYIKTRFLKYTCLSPFEYNHIWDVFPVLQCKICVSRVLKMVLKLFKTAKEVVRDHDTIFGNRDPPIAALAVTYGGLDIAWSSYGSYWRNMRKVFVREMLSNRSIEAGYNLRRDEVQKTVREIYTKIGTPIDIGDIGFLTQVNVTMSMLWGSTLDWEKTSNIKAEFREVVMKITETFGKPNISDFFPMLARFDVQGVERNMKRLFQWVERILDAVINERMKSNTMNKEGALENEEKKDFLQILLQLQEEEDTGKRINMTQIKALLMDIVVGGTDTTSTMVEFVMAEIINNPEVMKRVQEELADVVGKNNMVEESHLQKLLYMDAVVKETFRLHPPLPFLVPRRPSQSCIVGGYTIPKDSNVFLNVWAMHRDPQFWEDPLEFKPERFLNCNGEWDYSGNNFQYLPFGSGRRICAGIPLAERTLKYVLASFLHLFQWKLPEGEELELSERFGIVIKKKTPLIAIPTPILSNMDLYK
ncbi:unnamed protein product [Ilex paraguariensis]|uniref:Cytochrome P450 n=1 Tax=Ilex paraguariensis TaxID=185542 RepID=A0ABC8U277_9AQUA